ncbi:MAG: hypothetical protein HQK79_18045 [Desulfobacterales bacterium]|nr:hypothetical protein [Desulfobacterales bacterium]
MEKQYNKDEIIKIRTQFDEVLINHITRLLEIGSLSSTVSFNLSTISCLLLLVERENEIKSFPESPPSRYTRETFLDDLANLGLEIDNELMSVFQKLAEVGYVEVDGEGKYHAQISTFATVNFVNNLFPGMSGMNFIAYMVQTIEEVLSNRKNLNDAIHMFDQMLLARGVPLSKQKIEPVEKETAKAKIIAPVKKKLERKDDDDITQAYRQKLARFRAMAAEKETEPSVFVRSPYSGKLEIKELFPKKQQQTSFDPEPEVSNVKPEIPKAPIVEEPKVDLKPKEEIVEAKVEHSEIKEVHQVEPITKPVVEPVKKEAPKPQLHEEPKPIKQEPLEIKEEPKPPKIEEPQIIKEEPKAIKIEPPIAAKEEPKIVKQEPAPIKEEPKPLKKEEQYLQQNKEAFSYQERGEIKQPIEPQESSPKKKIELSDDDIEKQIEAFEEEHAITCPICNEGKIKEGMTGKGKSYYSCSNENCRFISWGKPYPFSCPQCKNLFLVEFNDPNGNAGLKCVRATCSYRQNHLYNPNTFAQPTTIPQPTIPIPVPQPPPIVHQPVYPTQPQPIPQTPYFPQPQVQEQVSADGAVKKKKLVRVKRKH